jgi:hypothetical protein
MKVFAWSIIVLGLIWAAAISLLLIIGMTARGEHISLPNVKPGTQPGQLYGPKQTVPEVPPGEIVPPPPPGPPIPVPEPSSIVMVIGAALTTGGYLWGRRWKLKRSHGSMQ